MDLYEGFSGDPCYKAKNLRDRLTPIRGQTVTAHTLKKWKCRLKICATGDLYSEYDFRRLADLAEAYAHDLSSAQFNYLQIYRESCPGLTMREAIYKIFGDVVRFQ